MLFTENSFKLGGSSVKALVSGSARSVISQCFVNANSLGPRFQHGIFTELVSVQMLGGFFTCMVELTVADLDGVYDLMLGLDWLMFLRENFIKLGVPLLNVLTVRINFERIFIF